MSKNGTITQPEVRIDPEFEKMIRELTDDEFQRLEDLCMTYGVSDTLKVWKQKESEKPILLDGHNRLKIAMKRKLGYDIEEVPGVKTRADAINWIKQHQLGRRNVTKEEKAAMLATRASAKVGTHGAKASGARISDVAAQEGVSGRTISRAKEITKAIDTIGERLGKEVKNRILAGRIKLSTEQKKQLAAMDMPTARKITNELMRGVKAKSAFKMHPKHKAGDAAEATGADAEAAGPPVDANGKVIPENLRDIFESTGFVADAITTGRRLKSMLKTILSWNIYVPQGCVDRVDDIVTMLGRTTPAALCYVCEGTKKDGNKPCAACLASGFVTAQHQESQKGKGGK